MIELHGMPTAGEVAVVAFLAVLALVGIIVAMALNASLSNALVALGHVAACTGHTDVLPLQDKVGFRVIEEKFGPTGFLVAYLATFAQFTAVWFIVLVAVDAARRGLAEFLIGLVARCAIHLRVTIAQREIRLVVVEGTLIQQDYVRLASLVVCVADLAVAFTDIRRAAVISLLLLQIRSHFLVAVDAQIVLRCLVEGRMALLALRLILGMTLYDGSGHDRTFETA